MDISLDELESFISNKYKKSWRMSYQDASTDYIVDGWNDCLDEIMWWIDEKRDAQDWRMSYQQEKQSTED